MTDTFISPENKRQGDWMQTASGRAFWPMDPRAEDVCIEDIAHALSNMCRFAGHCMTFYSVAQHSVMVASLLPSDLKLWGLLHDASEAYIVDVPRPLKPYLTGYKDAETAVMRAVVSAFDLSPVEMPKEVKRIDNAILADEAAQLMSVAPMQWTLPEPPTGILIEPWEPAQAYLEFMQAFHLYRGGA
ncbi:phosphohydrolase [uncultured Cohaesibacter sp.]|uniref:phosphohydrolase n=1 Tax=uncultured Cohaesibacter sp. TaxID=1002546 RepID=UPI0029C8283F|nr:phosphohydrolase [uncultured Cohaesibacter sp.]